MDGQDDHSRLDSRETMLTRARYDRQAQSYDAKMALFERIVIKSWRRRLWSSVRGQRILEVGAGTGANLAFYPPNAEVIAVDLSDQMLAQARQRSKRQAARVVFQRMDVEHLAFPEGHFDSAVCSFVFCSVPDPVRGLREVHRVLKHGGQMAMLEHVRPPGLLGVVFDLLNPILHGLMGANINRDTVANVGTAGFTIDHVDTAMLGIVKLIVASKRRG